MHKVLRRRQGFAQLHLDELWARRELLGFLVWRDVIVRYKETALGVIWAFFRPLVNTAIFSVLFGFLAKLPSDGRPYPLLTFAALLPWQLFSSGFSASGTSIVNNGYLISKIYFPRLILPLSGIGLAVVDLLISSIVLFVLMFAFGVRPPGHIIWAPLFVLLCIVFTLCVSLWTSALDVKYRDLRQLLPFATQVLMFVSPVAFSSSIVPAKYRLLYSINPMVGIVEGFRWAVLGGTAPLYLPALFISTSVALVLLVSGMFYFKNVERFFADLV
jgi:lipopolysaccharide transport system permease protein